MPFHNKNIFSVIVAGGSGSRMKSVIPKQFLPLFEKPILVHTVEKFLKIPHRQLIVVIPEKDAAFWEEIIEGNETLVQAKEDGILKTVFGGETRYQSVRNGLESIDHAEGLVAIHDSVRPLVSLEAIENSFNEAFMHGSAVLAVPLKDSIRKMDKDGSNHAIDRNDLRIIQTPQTFRLHRIKAAFSLGEQPFFTDDSSVYEYAGHPVHLIPGEDTNIKITTPKDLLMAELITKENK